MVRAMGNPNDEAQVRLGACRLHPRVAASLPAFCKTLAARLGRAVAPATYASYEELLQGFIAGQIELCWMPPVLLAQALAAGGTLLAVPQRAGNAGYRSAILVRRESAVRELRELRGLRAAWVDRASSSGYLYPRLELVRRLGFGDAQPFSSELFHGATVRAAAAVAAGEADLCACFVTEEAAKDPAQAEADSAPRAGPARRAAPRPAHRRAHPARRPGRARAPAAGAPRRALFRAALPARRPRRPASARSSAASERAARPLTSRAARRRARLSSMAVSPSKTLLRPSDAP